MRDQRNLVAALTRFLAVQQAALLETLAETFYLLSQSADGSLLRTFTLYVQYAGYSVAMPLERGTTPPPTVADF
eukprot:6453192-Pyramimonas_sp.AAC.1